MAEGNAKFRLLVKAARGAARAQLSFDRTNLGFKMTPLQAAPPGRGVTSAAIWHLLTPEPDLAVVEPWNIANPWDLCHELMRSGLGIAGAPKIAFAEPDFQQQWLTGRPGALTSELALGPPEKLLAGRRIR
jgi:hypothetical protein